MRRDAPVALTVAAVAVIAAVLLPPVYLVVRAAGSPGAVALVLAQGSTLRVVLDTALLVATVTAATVLIGVTLAWLTTRTDVPLRRMWAVGLSLPLVLPSYVAAFAFVAAIGPRGLLRELLTPLGVQTLPDPYGFPGAWLVLTLIGYPYIYLPVRAALLSMDRSLEEAARSLGRDRWATFRGVVLPMLRPALAAGGILVALYTLSDFGAVSLLRFDSLTSVVFIQYKSSFDRSGAAGLALVLVGLALLVVTLERATRGGAVFYTRGGRPADLVRLGGWRLPALALCALVALVALIVPLGVISYWAVRGIGNAADVGPSVGAAVNSLSAAALASFAGLAAALPVAVLVVRHGGRLAAALESAAYVGFALPGITIALALVFFAANFATPIYQTLALLVFAYVVRFLPEALGACRSALLQVSPRTEEAARSLGAGAGRVFMRITAPQMIPGLAAGALLVALTTMKELPITLLLGPFGFDTLATTIWTATNEGFFARAAVPSLGLVALSALAVAVLQREASVRE
ncbi:MAG: ABC transporter permease [Candidatus Limnocylindria bacterium]